MAFDFSKGEEVVTPTPAESGAAAFDFSKGEEVKPTLEQEQTLGGVASHAGELFPFVSPEHPFGTLLESGAEAAFGLAKTVVGAAPHNFTQAVFGAWAPLITGDENNLPPTALGIKNLAEGALQKLVPGTQSKEAAFEAAVNYIGQQFGHPIQNIQEKGFNFEAFHAIAKDFTKNLIKDPVGAFLTFSAVFSAGSSMLGKSEQLLKAAGLESAAGAAGKTAKVADIAATVTNPLTPIAKGASFLAEPAFNIAKKISQGLIKLPDKFLSTYKGGVAKGGGPEVFWDDFTNNVSASTKAQLEGDAIAEIDALGKTIDTLATGSSGNIKIQPLVDKLEGMKKLGIDEGGVFGSPSGIKRIDAAISELTGNSVIAGKEAIPVIDGIRLKQLFDKLNKTWTKEDPSFAGTALKGVADGLREQLFALPDIGAQLKKLFADQQFNILVKKGAQASKGVAPSFTDFLIGAAGMPTASYASFAGKFPAVKLLGIKGFRALSNVLNSTPSIAGNPEILAAFNALNSSEE